MPYSHCAPSTLRSPSAAPRRVACHLRAAALATMVPLLFLSACGSGSTTTSPAAAPTLVSAITVTIQNFAFHPAKFTVSPGATITVINDDEVIHTLTADNAETAFNSGDVTKGVPVSFPAPTQPGTYPFHDHLRSYMTGVLTVS
jgi:plastocyanin